MRFERNRSELPTPICLHVRERPARRKSLFSKRLDALLRGARSAKVTWCPLSTVAWFARDTEAVRTQPVRASGSSCAGCGRPARAGVSARCEGLGSCVERVAPKSLGSGLPLRRRWRGTPRRCERNRSELLTPRTLAVVDQTWVLLGPRSSPLSERENRVGTPHGLVCHSPFTRSQKLGPVAFELSGSPPQTTPQCSTRTQGL